jgi:hypothetical protein
MVKIAFWDNCLCECGTTVATYDYAYFNKYILNNESIIMYNITKKETEEKVVNKFKKEFEVFGVDEWLKVDDILLKNNCDILYITKGGNNEGQISRVIKTVVHCVFNTNEPHGDIYACISDYIDGNENFKYPVVPYMVYLPENKEDMRKELNIPKNAKVFGRHGGKCQFNIQYVKNIVYEIAINNPDIYFLFLNTNKFCPDLPNIIHIPLIADLNEKVKFINTCDAMLWAREMGESFGLAIAEFSIKNKPVFYTNACLNAHCKLLGDKGIYYNDNTLKNLLLNFDKEEAKIKDWNAYKEYTPEKVMEKFKSTFIDPFYIKKKAAICLFGQPRLYKKGFDTYNKFMDNNKEYNFDIFYHTWFDENTEYYETNEGRYISLDEKKVDKQIIEKLNNLYNPKKIQYEKPIQFDLKKYENTLMYKNTEKLNRTVEDNNFYSQCYSRNKVRNILNDYFIKTNEKYEFVITGRFDFLNEINIKLNELNSNNIYTSNIHLPRKIISDSLIISNTENYLNIFNIHNNFDILLDNNEIKNKMEDIGEQYILNSEEIIFSSIISNNLLENVIPNNMIPDFK